MGGGGLMGDIGTEDLTGLLVLLELPATGTLGMSGDIFYCHS